MDWFFWDREGKWAGSSGSGRVSGAPQSPLIQKLFDPEPADPDIKAAGSWKTT